MRALVIHDVIIKHDLKKNAKLMSYHVIIDTFSSLLQFDESFPNEKTDFSF